MSFKRVFKYSIYQIDKDLPLSWMYKIDAELQFEGQRLLKSFMISPGARLRLL